MSYGWGWERVVTEPFHDTGDEQGILRLDAWRRAARCQEYGTLMDDQVTAVQAHADITFPTLTAPSDSCVYPHGDAS
jgi:hypothetical protein